MRESQVLKGINQYDVLSIGCGGCADLMALERFCHELSFDKTIRYHGIDINERWKPIHEVIKHYRTSTIKNVCFSYSDATVLDENIPGANVIVLQYIVSLLFDRQGANDDIDNLFNNIIDHIIAYAHRPCVILINDVNSIYRGRDYCDNIISSLRSRGIGGCGDKFYFETQNMNDAQRIGKCHPFNNILFHDDLFSISQYNRSFINTYDPWQHCTSFQMLLKIF